MKKLLLTTCLVVWGTMGARSALALPYQIQHADRDPVTGGSYRDDGHVPRYDPPQRSGYNVYTPSPTDHPTDQPHSTPEEPRRCRPRSRVVRGVMYATSSSCATFQRINIDRFPNLNSESFDGAWRDPEGLIWGNELKNADGSTRTMTLAQAREHCSGIGASLPNHREVLRLREYMGAEPGFMGRAPGYHAQIISGLGSRGKFLWVSSNTGYEAYIFDGSDGEISIHDRALRRDLGDDVSEFYLIEHSVRCVTY